MKTVPTTTQHTSSAVSSTSFKQAAARILRLVLLTSVLAVPNLSRAVSACPKPAPIKQPDGKIIDVYLKGDEFLHWHEDADGFTILKDEGSGKWVHAVRDAKGNLAPSASVVGQDNPQKLNVPRHLTPVGAVEQRKAASAQRLKNGGPSRTSKVGTMKNLVVLVQFSDLTATRTAAEFESLFNTIGYSADGAQGSVKDYYNEVSYNLLSVDSVVADWITLDNGYAYYGGNDSEGYDIRPREMVAEALTKLEARGFDFSTVDGDNDGWVDGLTIIHAGGAEEYSGNNTNYIWSHKWSLESTLTFDGRSMREYHTEQERRGSDSIPSSWGITRIGVICHETGHFLGLPDLYDIDYTSVGVGDFCLMAGGSWNGNDGTVPAHMSAWCKKTLGWVTPTVVSGAGTYTVTRVEDNPTIYQLNGAFPSSQYFLIENRQGYGYDAGLPGFNRGLLIWHIDEVQTDNSDETHYLVDVEEASGTQHLELNQNSGNDSDYYRAGNNIAFSDAGTPNNLSYSGTPLGLNITDVSISGASMTFTVGGGSGFPAPVLTIEPATTSGTENTIYWSPVQPPSAMPIAPSARFSQMQLSSASAQNNIEPSSATLPAEYLSRAPGLEENDKGPVYTPKTWQTIFSETFEGVFPGGSWSVYGSPSWDDTNYDYHSGSWSAWCGGTSLSPSAGYANNMNAWMVYGPFSLSDATTARVNFWYSNYSEENYDYFRWLASTNGINFFGQQISGDQFAWRSQVFDLSNVFSIGNLCGKSQVWIAFVFTSDNLYGGDFGFDGAWVDDVVIEKDVPTGNIDLMLYQPAEWNNKIPIGTNQLSGTNIHDYAGPFYDNQTLYFNWASINGGANAAGAYTVRVEVTGTGGGTWTWSPTGLEPYYYNFVTLDQAAGPLSAGTHTFKVWIDYNGDVSEINETNNYYERTITVLSSVPVEYYAECDDDQTFASPLSSSWITQTNYTFTGLTVGQTYSYRVKARQGTTESDWSNVEASQQGEASVISVNPPGHDFGTLESGTTADRTFTVQNTGSGTLSGTASVASPFSIVSGSPYTLAANETANVTVRFSPVNTGSASANVLFTGGGGATRAVSGTAFTRVGLTNASGNLTLSWGAGTLYSADDVAGPWTPVLGAAPPFVITPTSSKKFYRIEE